MDEIKQSLLPHFGLVFWTIIIGLTLACIYLVLKKIFVPIIGSKRTRQNVLIWRDHLEKLFWPIFIICIGISLIISQPLVGLALSLFIVAILYKTLTNYFLGLIYMLGKNYVVGQRIRYKKRQGTIKAFNNLTLEMELEDGESLDIPYSYFADATIIRTSSQSGIISHTINIPILKPCNLEQEKKRIKGMLLALPWVLPNQKIVFEHFANEPSRFILKVIVYGIDKNHLYKVEHKIKAMYLNEPELSRIQAKGKKNLLN